MAENGSAWPGFVESIHTVTRADFRGEMPQLLRGEDQRVVVHLAQILGRLFLQLHASVHVRRHPQAVVGARRVGGQTAAAVDRADLELGEAIERPSLRMGELAVAAA